MVSVDTLRKTWLLNDLDPTELKALADACVETTVSPGKSVLAKDQKNDSLWIVAKGNVAVQDKDNSGVLRRVAELKEGDIFGEMSWLDGQAASTWVTAGADCVLLRISFEDFNAILNQYLEAQVQVLKKFAINLSQRLRG